jgi:hypothetical protein
LIALALFVAVVVVIGEAAKGFQRYGGKACGLPSTAMAERRTESSTPTRGHAHVDTTPTPTVTQRMRHRYFNAIRDDDKQTDCHMYRIPGCGDRTSSRLAAAAARALLP